ncbi:class I adenylate cyclase [Litoribrevibacter euphylliae]|uniref:Class I adenylate cyclase n=1 Tax=Litoribrevibacter euphylliae TaxID=1834034 RepID=A0ABV7HK74_9GAMM
MQEQLVELPDINAIQDIEDTFLQVNALRLQRTRDSLTIRQQGFIDLLPLLFHFNNPSLPGYCHKDTPCGISRYRPGRESLSLPRNVTMSLKRQKQQRGHRAIEAIYLMGSTGTIAHSRRSDFDVWICTHPEMPLEEQELLSRKCEKITEWAQKLGVEAYFFLMDPIKFRSGLQGELTEESCGSTQHFLLLDEFYRTAILVAGKKPAWWFVPLSQHHIYDAYVKDIFDRRLVEPEEYLDFGPINEFPISEFLGAGMWQLYKAIDSPHKSAIKLMIADVYASEYPNTIPLSQRFKEALHNSKHELVDFDPYIMAYRVIENFLKRKPDLPRLEIVRRCFYFKVGIKASKFSEQPHLTWRENLLQQLLEEWGWSQEKLEQLDNVDHWNVHQVAAERKAIVSELIKSYTSLTDFARQYGTASTMSARDISILGRKLYAAFERKPGKIEFINPGITKSLEHQDLTFSYHKHKESQQHIWEVYAGRSVSLITPPIYRAKTLIKTLSWCRVNGILSKNSYTYLDTNTQAISQTDLHQLVDIVLDQLPFPQEKLKQEVFSQPAYYKQIIIVANTGKALPTNLSLADNANPLSYGKEKVNLVESLELVMINSWNEVITKHFSGDSAIKQCLYLLINCIPKQKEKRPQISVRCLGSQFNALIRTKLKHLAEQISLIYGNIHNSENTRLIVECGKEYLVLQAEENEGNIQSYLNISELFNALGAPQSSFSPIALDSNTLKSTPLDAISRVIQKDHIQVFYELEPAITRAKIYIVDECGSLLFYTTPFNNPESLLNPLMRFLRSVLFRQQTQLTLNESQLLSRNIHFWEIIRTQQQSFQLRPVDIAPSNRMDDFFNVQAIGDGSTEARLKFTLYCNQEEFSELEYGDQLYTEVAKYILSIRKNKERYPCYLTDLELAKSDSTPFPPGSLQTIHYLRQKSRLEKRLNHALQSVKI